MTIIIVEEISDLIEVGETEVGEAEEGVAEDGFKEPDGAVVEVVSTVIIGFNTFLLQI